MSDLDQKIKETLQQRVADYKAPVDPSVWSAIQSGMGSSAGPTADGGGVTTWAKVSFVSIVVIAMTAVVFNVLLSEEPTPEVQQNETTLEKQKQRPAQITDLNQEDIGSKADKSIEEAHPKRKEESQQVTEKTIEEVNELATEASQNKQERTVDENGIRTKKEPTNSNPNTGMMGSGSDVSGALSSIDYAPLKGTFSATQDAFDHLSYLFRADEDAHAYFWNVDGKTFTRKAFDYEFEQTGEYQVELTVTDRIGRLSKQAKIIVVNEKSKLVIPNIFTPNGDGKNARFDVERASLGITVVDILIFNISGELVFRGDESIKSWDGNLPNGDPATEGNYTVQLKVREQNGQEYNSSALIVLRR